MSSIVVALLAILAVAFGIGLSVAVAMGLGGIVLSWMFNDRPVMDILGFLPWNVTTGTTLVALPLFILMGELLMRSGITDRMYSALAKWLAPLPGGLLHTNIVACAMFSCVSGSSSATAASIGGVALPSLRKYGYSERLSLGSLAAGGTLGILIPPSIAFVVYAVLVEASIGQLYLASIIPGLIMTLLFMLVIFIASVLRPNSAPAAERASWREKIVSLGSLLPVVALMLVVLGTIYAGIATATEAAAFGAVFAFMMALVTGRVNMAMLRESFMVTATTTAMILFILIGAFILQFVLAFLGIPAAMSRLIMGMGLSQLEVVLMVCVIYLVLGTFMEELSMVITTIPVLLPVLKSVGVDLVWFGVIVVILIQAAIISPPVGMNLFILQGIREQIQGKEGRRPISDVFIGVMPFFCVMLVTLVLIIAFPQTTQWLVQTSQAK